MRDHELNIAAICYKILHVLTNNGGKYTPKRGENVQIEIQRKVWPWFLSLGSFITYSIVGYIFL